MAKAKYTTTWKKGQDFYTWCKFWTTNGSAVRLDVWKTFYSSIVSIEKNNEELFKKHGRIPTQREKDYFVRCEDGDSGFMTRKDEEDWWKTKVIYSGKPFKWIAHVKKSTTEIFE
jgi:hypothetical protein